jgi:crossover junction endodeoxyribonuclease RuvC
LRILGIDPGLVRTGFGIIECHRPIQYVASGVIHSKKGALSERLHVIAQGVLEVINTFGPDAAAIEMVFMHRNAQAALLLGQARGAAIAMLAQKGIFPQEYTALVIKETVVGYGHAGKLQVQSMVRRILSIPSALQTDAADALAVALCAAYHLGKR